VDPEGPVIVLLAIVAFLFFPYIGLEVRADLAGRVINIPAADLAVLLLLPFVALAWRRGNAVPLPGWPGWVLLVIAGLLAASDAPDAGAARYTLFRKPVFLYLAWGGGFAWAVARTLRVEGWRLVVELSALAAAGLLLWSSVGRIEAGNSLWWTAIAGLTNNHKTLAVALAPLVPLILGLAPAGDGRARAVLAVVLLALALSVSRTAWISAAFALGWFIHVRGRPLSDRRGLLALVVAGGALAALYAPLLTGSLAQLDAARSRHSLDKRAWSMFVEHPWTGMGAGSNTLVEVHTFPDYRVNGVDAHGVVQKVASEFGLLGLLGWGLAMGATAWTLRAGASGGGRLDRALWVAFLTLHVNLLLSTETFSQTHWAVLGLVWGLAWRSRR